MLRLWFLPVFILLLGWPGCSGECKGHFRNKMERNAVINQHSLLKMSILHRAKPQGREKSHDISRNATGSNVANLWIMRWEGKTNVVGWPEGLKKHKPLAKSGNCHRTSLCLHVLKVFSQKSYFHFIQFFLPLRSFLEEHPRTRHTEGKVEAKPQSVPNELQGGGTAKNQIPGSSKHCALLSLRGLARNPNSRAANWMRWDKSLTWGCTWLAHVVKWPHDRTFNSQTTNMGCDCPCRSDFRSTPCLEQDKWLFLVHTRAGIVSPASAPRCDM